MFGRAFSAEALPNAFKHKSRYNNRLIAKLMLMWRRDESLAPMQASN
jgi:hypothetical protein